MILFKKVCLVAAFAAVLAAAFSAHAQITKRPAILIDNWGGELDLAYMKQLQAAGFEVDAISHDKLVWEKLKQYNVLIMTDFPDEGTVKLNPWGGPASGPNLTATIALLDQFLKAGGGVMLNLVQHGNSPVQYNVTQKALQRWGAKRPLETVAIPPDQVVEHPRLRISFYFTDNVLSSPVSDGVKGVWFPQGGAWTYMTGPIEVDNTWTIVLRGPRSSRSIPIPLPEKKPGIPYYETPFVRDGGVLAPPLFAIRDLNPGRLALFHASPIFHIGSGTSWIHSGAMLDKGLNNKPSDFGKLFVNTLRWLAAPSLASDQLGGAKMPADRWARPLEKTDNPNYKNYLGAAKTPDLNPDLAPPEVKIFKGMVGPRTSYSGGQGTVAEYADTARQKGMSFIIFLEDMAQLTPEKLAKLTADCKANSGKDLLLISGYRAKTNLGNQIFLFGADPLFIHDKYLSADKKTLMLQPQDKDGKFTPSRFIDFVFESLRNDINSIGYFDFTGPMKTGGLALHDLRLFSMAGIVYYDHGRLVEDVTDQFLLTNAGTLPGSPVAINLVDSPAAMAAAVDAQQGVTYAGAHSVERLWSDALRWNHPYGSWNVFPSSGPLIRHWPHGVYRTGAYAGERFVANRMLVTPFLQVSSDCGLKEISVYDGDHLFRRFLPNGAREFTTRLFLSGSIFRNMSLVATDVKGGKAVSYPLRGWNDGAPAAVFCSDHVNDGPMRLFRGPGWSRFTSIPLVPEPGQTWDGMGEAAKLPLIGWGELRPTFTTSAGAQADNLCQTPMIEFCDDNVWRGRSISRGIMAPGVSHMNPWSGFGPITPTPLVDMVGIFTEWARYQTGTATGWGPMGLEGGPTASLYTQTNTFKKDCTLTRSVLGYEWRRKIPANVLLLVGTGDKIVTARDVSPRVSTGTVTHRIGAGDWFAAVSPQESNAMLFVNRGVPLILEVGIEKSELREDLPVAGVPVKSGETRTVEWFTCWWPMDQNIPDSEKLLRWVRYFQNPDGMEILRGKRMDSPIGVIELEAEKNAAEVKIPRSPDKLDANLPIRVSGLNPRWSAILWQKDGYIGAGRYGKAQNRFRSLGVDFDGHVYFPVYSGQAALTQMVAGQPVVADAAGKDIFIEVVCLKDAEGQNPPLWHVSVNNPTDKPVNAKLSKTMALPGLAWDGENVLLATGEYKILVHPSYQK